ncbi:MAG: hypothetical protein KDE15_08365 [Erythrobacter sp.]|nr:hypothetical protein [Erythrobacter sp.]
MDDRLAADALAKKRFVVINVLRLSGVAMVIAGMAVFNQGLDLPEEAGVALMVVGMFDVFVAPLLLARRWSSNQRP